MNIVAYFEGNFILHANFNDSNIFGNMVICSTHSYFEQLKVNPSARSEAKEIF